MSSSSSNNLFSNYLLGWKKIFDYSGRTNRKDYWSFVLIDFLLIIFAFIVLFLLTWKYLVIIYWDIYEIFYSSENIFSLNYNELLYLFQPVWKDNNAFSWICFYIILYSAIKLLFFIPVISASCRRLHDTNKSGFYLLLIFIPIIGFLILVFMLIQPSYDKKDKLMI